uniref:Uncharacterized protein n=1 Tax=Arundo donax TaxID=35708 RepID=A0A0A8ZE29_ARUDO
MRASGARWRRPPLGRRPRRPEWPDPVPVPLDLSPAQQRSCPST